MPAKKSTKKRTSSRKSSANVTVKRVSRLRISDSELPFMTFQITKQTFYWSVLMVFILVVQVWVLNLQLQAADAIRRLEEAIILASY